MEPLDKYLSLFPDHEQALFGKAVACSRPAAHAEAVEEYRKVLARNPRCEEALSNLVAMFLEKKDHESVRRYAEMLVELQPESTRGDGSPGHAGLRRRRLSRRRALLPQPFRNGSRPVRKLVQPGRGLSQDGQSRKGRAGLPPGHRAEAAIARRRISTWAWRTRN